jgi:hypothetical protein
MGVSVGLGVLVEVGLAATPGAGKRVGTDFSEGAAGEQADKQKTSRSRMSEKPCRAILNPLGD